MPTPRFLLAIPVYNEEQHLLEVLAEARKYIEAILVVDDGSTDGTAELLAGQRGLAVVQHPINRGYGASLGSAFSFAIRRGYDWLITMDCDRQHEPSLIPEFMAVAQREAADVVSGSRYLRALPGDQAPPPDRRQINARITELLNERLGLSLTDAFCGFKAYRVDALRRVGVTEPGYAMPLQFWVQAALAGLRIVELPVPLIYPDPRRQFGGGIDDPVRRFRYYVNVLETELERLAPMAGPAGIREAC